jgi:hypothetical protein
LHSYHYKSEGIATRVSTFAATFDFDATSVFDGAPDFDGTFTRAPAYPAGLQPYRLFARLQGWLYRRL